MLAELAVANWRPRWYYVMLNKTSGMRYVGQTFNLDSRSYCGSGQYWVAHCKKHGVKNPGTNYVNMDRQAFHQWRAQHVG